jgi:Fe-S-cluster-containing dehydrogenase component
MTKKWNMVIDVALCHDCNNCFMADKDEYVGNDFLPYSVAQPWSGHRWMNVRRKERGQFPLTQVAYLPLPCQHCGDAPCIKDSPEGTIYRREDGLVIIDPEKARGHKEIVATCPYGVIYWNEEAQLAQKCTGCAHLMDAGWTETRCSQVCPTGAIKLVLADDEEMAKLKAEEGLEDYWPSLETQPRTVYKNVHRWNKSFISGTVAYRDTDDCAEDAVVLLRSGGAEAGRATTNNYGDFVIDKLDPGQYEVTITADGYSAASRVVDLTDSINLGVLFLEK